MSNTTTDTLTFARTPEEITTRLNSWAESQQPCWVIFATESGIWVRSFGRLSNTDAVYALNDDQNMSGVSFPLSAVESVGQACIFLRS